MKFDCEYTELVNPEKLVPHPRNNNRHPFEQLDLFARYLDATQVWRYPIVVSRRSGFIISGHGSTEVAKILSLKEIPVTYQDFKNEAEEYHQLTFDNEIARWAELDRHAVYVALEEIPDVDVDMLGIEKWDYEKLEPEIKPEKDIDIDAMSFENVCPKCNYEW